MNLKHPTGQIVQNSYSQAQVVPLSSDENSARISVPNPSSLFNEECVSENVLVQDLIYSFQGIEGKILKFDHNDDSLVSS